MYENCKNRKIEGGQEVEVELQIPIILGENGEDAAEEERVKITIFFVENLLLFPGNPKSQLILQEESAINFVKHECVLLRT